MSIQNYLNQIKTAVFGKDVRQSIHDAIKQCYDDASVDHDNANMEVKLARGTHETLNDRITENEKNQENLSSQLDKIENTKANKDDVARISRGTPLFANSIDEMTDITKNYVNNIDGYIYVYNGSIFEKSTVKYQERGLSDGQVIPSKTSFIAETSNLVDKRYLLENKYVSPSGEIVDFDGYYTTELMLFEKSVDYTFSNARNICYYDENITKVSYFDNPNNTQITKSTPIKASYVRCSFKKEYLNTFKIEKGSQLTSYEAGGLKSERLIIDLNNISEDVLEYFNNLNSLTKKLENKILLNLGDSIAFGSGNKGIGYGEIIANKYNMIYHDYSNGGATIGMTKDNNILTQLDNAIASGITPDYVLFDGGTNDINSGSVVPLGDITEAYSGVAIDISTFTGGMEQMCKKIRNTWPETKIIYVRVHNMGSRDIILQKQYGERAIEVCNKWNTTVIDLFKNGQLNTNINAMWKYTNNNDKTHPNGDGYLEFYVPPIEATLLHT